MTFRAQLSPLTPASFSGSPSKRLSPLSYGTVIRSLIRKGTWIMYKALALALSLTLVQAALAANMNFMKDAPVTTLTKDELTAFSAFVDKTLSEGAEGSTVEWKAPKTPFTSKLTPAKTYKADTLECRDVRIESESRDRAERGTYTFCKKGDRWGFKSPSKKQAAKQQ